MKTIRFVPFALLLCISAWLNAQTLTHFEYFFDTDPGVSHGTHLTIATPSDSVSMNVNIPVGSLSQGFHRLYVRAQYSTGLWGIENSSGFYVNTLIDTGAGPKINAGEYFFDTDPGVGKATAIAISTAADSINQVLNIPIASLGQGFHQLFARYHYTDGTWGIATGSEFYVNTLIDTGAGPKINAGEYYFDTDPGVGHGTAIAVGTPSDSINQVLNIPIGSLSQGFHQLFARYHYTDGIWGIVTGSEFYVNTLIDTGADPKISGAEYFFDTEPGLGHGTSIPVGTASDSVNLNLTIPVNSLSAGFHHLYTRFKYTNNTWGLEDAHEFYVIPTGLVGTSPEIDSAEYFYDSDPGVGKGIKITVNPATDSANLALVPLSTTGLTPGPHYLFVRFKYTNGVWGLYQGVGGEFTVCTPPLDTIRASGPISYCAGGSVTLTSDTSYNWSYQWQRNGTNLPGDTFSTLLVTDSSGVYDIIATEVTDTGNCPGTSNSITVTVKHSTTNVYSRSICSGQSLSFYGHTLTTPGTYRDTLTNLAGCDSFVILTLSVSNGLQTNIADSICPGSSFPFKGLNLTLPGIYRDTLIATGGCDSIVILALSLKQIGTGTLRTAVCQGDSLLFNGHYYGAVGTYHDTLGGSNGCDSIATLILTINNPVTVNIARHVCQGSTYSFNGMNLDTSGTYRDTLPGSNTCDSITVLQFTVLAPVTSTDSVSTCAGTPYHYNGHTYDTAGTFIDTLNSSLGCDSIVTLTLHVLPVSLDSTSASICQGTSYPFKGQSLTNAGSYNDTLQGINGCDSIVTLTLTVDTLPAVSWSGNVDTTCKTGNPISLSGGLPTGGTYSGPGVYHGTFYPDSASAGANVISYTYTDGSGCSDTAHKTIVVKICTGIAILNESTIKLYPNPASDEVTLECSAFTNSKAVIGLRDVTGKTIDINYDLNADKIRLHIGSFAQGMYVVTIWLNGEEVSLRFVKD